MWGGLEVVKDVAWVRRLELGSAEDLVKMILFTCADRFYRADQVYRHFDTSRNSN